MIAARYIARSLAAYGRADLQTAVRLTAAGGNPHRIARRYQLTAREVASLATLAEAVADVERDQP